MRYVKSPQLIALEEFFFTKKFGPGETPLFTSIREMAELMKKDSKNNSSKKTINAIACYLSQIFRNRCRFKTKNKAVLLSILKFTIKEKKLSANEKFLLKEFETLAQALLNVPLTEQSKVVQEYESKFLGIDITTEDLQYLVDTVTGAGGKLKFEILLALLKNRKNIN